MKTSGAKTVTALPVPKNKHRAHRWRGGAGGTVFLQGAFIHSALKWGHTGQQARHNRGSGTLQPGVGLARTELHSQFDEQDAYDGPEEVPVLHTPVAGQNPHWSNENNHGETVATTTTTALRARTFDAAVQSLQSVYWLHASDGAAQLLVPQSQSPAGQLADVGPAPVPVEHRCVALHHPHCTWPRRQTTATRITTPLKQTKKNAQPSRTWLWSLQVTQSVYWLHVSVGAAHVVVPQSQSPDGQLADVGPLALPVEQTLLYEHHPQAATSLQLTQSLYWLHVSVGAAHAPVPQSQSPAGQLAAVGPTLVPVEHTLSYEHHPHCPQQPHQQPH